MPEDNDQRYLHILTTMDADVCIFNPDINRSPLTRPMPQYNYLHLILRKLHLRLHHFPDHGLPAVAFTHSSRRIQNPLQVPDAILVDILPAIYTQNHTVQVLMVLPPCSSANASASLLTLPETLSYNSPFQESMNRVKRNTFSPQPSCSWKPLGKGSKESVNRE